MKRIVKIAALAAMVLALAGCKGRNRGPLLPNVSGKAGEIVVVIDKDNWEGEIGNALVVVIDKDNWEGEIGNALRGILADDCPYLAQREPLFNLANVPPGSFNNMFKMHRNILILNINPQNQTTGMMYKRDQWARPQSVAQVNAYGLEDALSISSPRRRSSCPSSSRRRSATASSRIPSCTRSLPCATPWRSLPAASCISPRATSSAR